MSKLKLADFCYGAFLSALLNSPGGRPSLFDETSSRRIYKLETNNSQECYIYTKYTTAKDNKSERFKHWTFSFSDEEIQKLNELYTRKRNVKLALICVKKGFANSEIALIEYDEAMECLGIQKGIKSLRINVKSITGKHGLWIYGSGRSDKLNGKDNMLNIPRDRLTIL